MEEELQRLKQTVTVTVKGRFGLHARPAAAIARLVQHKKAMIAFVYEGKQADPRSMLDLLMLGAPEGSEILIKTEGKEAVETLKILVDLFETGFDHL